MSQAMSPRVVICGKGRLACEAFDYLMDLRRAGLLARAVAAVPVQGDVGRDTWEPSLRARCRLVDLEPTDTIANLRLTADDVLFSLQYDRIVRLEQLGGARAFNLHFSALPDYRGCYPSMWPIRNGEAQVGVTLHVLTAGIDDGAIVDQEIYRLPPFLDAFGLYQLHHAYGYEVFKRNLPIILEAQEKTRPPVPASGRYYDRRSIDFTASDLIGFQHRSAKQCVGFLKSLIFPPFQLPTLTGRTIVDAEEVNWPLPQEELERLPVTLSETQATAVLRCKDGLIRVRFQARGERSSEE